MLLSECYGLSGRYPKPEKGLGPGFHYSLANALLGALAELKQAVQSLTQSKSKK
jgi:hypothetical protein